MRETWLADYAARIDEVLDRCESPIEQLFVSAMLVAGWERLSDVEENNGRVWKDFLGLHGHVLDPDGDTAFGDVTLLSCSDCYDAVALIQPHVLVHGKRLRPDLLLAGMLGPFRSLVAVELDGHDFHERTKEQAKRDKSRDRLLQAQGWKAIRFTGAEVFADAPRCVAEAQAVLNADGNAAIFPRKGR